MKSTHSMICALILAVLPAADALAVSLSLVPSGATVGQGAAVSIDVVVSGLTDGGTPSLGGFDLDIGFDPLALALTGYSLGPALGDTALFEALDVSFGEYAPGVVNLAEVSLLAAAALNSAQADAFVLATLNLTVLSLAPGATTVIDFATVFGLTDGLGDALVLDATSGATLTGAPVPLPAGWLLLASALVVLAKRRTTK